MAMFDTTKTLKTPAKGKKSDKAEVEIKGLEQYAAIDATMKVLKALLETQAESVKGAMVAHFIKVGAGLKKRPENFKGIEAKASASCELRIRSSASALSEADVEILTKHDIPVKTVESVVDTFVVNPAYLKDEKVLKAVEKALKGAKGIPEDLFLHQVGEAKTVVAEDALDVLFTKEEAVIKELLSMVSTPSIKPKMEDGVDPFAIVQAMLAGDDEEAE